MKKFIYTATLIALFLILQNQGLVSQENEKLFFDPVMEHTSLPLLSKSDSIALAGLPVLEAGTAFLKQKDLPAVLDNSTQPYFRPLFEQVASECGQYASIAFTFTYELNYSRNTPANVPENQLPTHYTYNFMNGGYGWHGVSYFYSFDVAKRNGHPSVTDFGTMNSCGPSLWMNGYEKYYNGMSNKIEEVYQIPVGTPEGLLVLKNWLHNHLTGDDVGGIACFYSSTPWNLTSLPQGTPEGGKHVISNFLYPASHSSTITGYNDSIRFDYNQDGQYTNHIDINGDGKVTMKDWEIGGLRFTDSYLGGVNWADSGFCYMMYKSLADKIGEGGIWNNVVHVVKAKTNYEPKLTLKLNMEHTCREKIKIMAGVSNNPESDYPEWVMGFPVFDFQGGCQPMQGGWEPDAKQLELGLDITPLLGRITSGEEVGFFLQVYENDPYNSGSGKVLNYSIIDHMNNDTEYPYPTSNIPLTENGLTTLRVTAALDFNALNITTSGLPLALTNEPYSHQMSAEGGTTPYTWKLIQHYEETVEDRPFPAIDESSLVFPDTVHSQALQPIEFNFPFYGKSYDSIWVHTDGFIMFDDQAYPWPYFYDEHLLVKQTKNIAPFANGYLYIDPAKDNGVWYEGNEEHAAFRWKVSTKFPSGGSYDFALIIHADGEVEFYYNNGEIAPDNSWTSGISNGDGSNYQFTGFSGFKSDLSNQATILQPAFFPNELTLSESGLLSGTPAQNYPGIDLLFDLTDQDGLNRRQSFTFYCYVAGEEEHPNLEDQALRIWPNPAKKQFHVEFSSKSQAKIALLLLDQLGNIVRETNQKTYAPGQWVVDFNTDGDPGLAPGIYYLMLKANGRISKVEKIVITNP